MITPEQQLHTGYSGARLLLVDDDEINLEMAELLLTRAGMVVDTAMDGFDAVIKVRNNDYDLVLMDLQMPVMGGEEASWEIRSIPGKELLPILAIGANTGTLGLHRLQKMGMDGAVKKPFDPDNLYTQLIRWLPQQASTTQQSAPAIPSHEEEDPYLQQLSLVDGVDVGLGLRNSGGDQTVYLRMLRRFIPVQVERLKRLEEALQHADYPQVQALSHVIKGASGTLGFVTLQQLAEQIEQASGDSAMVNLSAVEPIIGQINSFLQTLQPLFDGGEEALTQQPSTPLSATEVTNILRQIHVLLLQDRAEVNPLMAEQSAQLIAVLGQRATELEQEIEAYNYPQALSRVEQLLAERDAMPELNPQLEVVDLTQMESKLGIGAEKMRETLNHFLSYAEEILSQAAQALHKQDREQLQFVGHKLKTSAGMVGAMILGHLALELEESAAEYSWQELEVLQQELVRALQAVAQFVEDMQGG